MTPDSSLLNLQNIHPAAVWGREILSLKESWVGPILMGERFSGEARVAMFDGDPSPFSGPPRKGLLDSGQRECQGVTDKPTTSEPLPFSH